MIATKLKAARYGLLAGIACFGLFIIISLVMRSRDRSSIVSPFALLPKSATTSEIAPVAELASSKLHLQEFHRVEVKDGKPVWEIRAAEAQHFPEDNLIHVNQASLKVYRKGESPIEVNSKAARLFATGTSLSKAVLEGDISVKVDDSVEINTDLATFDVAGQVIIAPDHVLVNGPGYQIQGDGLRFLVDSKQFEFAHNVQSRFDQGAKGPKEKQSW